MAITLMNNKKNKKIYFALSDKTEALVKENEQLAKEVNAKIAFNEELDNYLYKLHQKANKELKEIKETMAKKPESKAMEY
ncbi:hypothetical protein MHK_004611 [Candidatus Magnetomorum sp. HK-1]|nr:hypothetical protein MHK_004611 [Candidatus Magnetomorum sp. HK-1]